MLRYIQKKAKKYGAIPGTLIHLGRQKADKIKFSKIIFDENHFEMQSKDSIEQCFPFPEKPRVTWLNIDGLHDVKVVDYIGNKLGIHPLLLEDILNTTHRPKWEDYEDYIFIVLKLIDFKSDLNEVRTDQVSLLLGNQTVLTFQEMERTTFEPIILRLQNSSGRIRKMGADYLLYALMDLIIDSYFITLEKIAEKIEALEEEILSHPKTTTLKKIHKIKREMIYLRKTIWPVREVISKFQRSDSKLIDPPTLVFLDDLYDHIIQIIETIDTFRDMLNGMHDTYLSIISNRLNEVMKVLTIISTIFIPLTFIVGVYGMNFKYMPELEWRNGYFLIWGIMLVIFIVMLIFFKRKKWW
jgi:magnesium transporter